MTKAARVGVIGAGGWGTALGIVANRAGSDVTLWTRNEHVIDSISKRRVNEPYLPDVFIDPSIQITSELNEVCQHDYVILAVPSQYLRALCISISDMLASNVPLVIATKGIERGSLMMMSEVVRAILPHNPIAILSGPNFAKEVATGMPSATTIACTDQILGEKLIYSMGGKFFRPYYSNDVMGAQVGGAIKNVIAIASGICIGRGLGENARAALVTRGMAEMSRLADIKGGRSETLMGLCGMGDLILSCASQKSRNMALGYAIGQGNKPDEVVPSNKHGLTEGVMTAESVYQISQKLGVNMPIARVVHQVLHNEIDIDSGIELLLERPFAPE
ncbi:MAG: glycerol-3-phosphate acyltransferase [Rickettsiales bacterium]|nr:glycerol-3-phosphate acyltransferase [Rickettsiales bacterium]